MSFRRHASKPYNLTLFLGHPKGQILKDVTHKAGDLPGAQAERPTFFFFF
jgi:hypothetical protein